MPTSAEIQHRPNNRNPGCQTSTNVSYRASSDISAHFRPFISVVDDITGTRRRSGHHRRQPDDRREWVLLQEDRATLPQHDDPPTQSQGVLSADELPPGGRPIQPPEDLPIQSSGDHHTQPPGDHHTQPQEDRLTLSQGDRPIQPQGDRLVQDRGGRIRPEDRASVDPGEDLVEDLIRDEMLTWSREKYSRRCYALYAIFVRQPFTTYKSVLHHGWC